MSRTLIGTIGQSVWLSDDAGETWSRGKGTIFIESDVRSLLPVGNGRVFAGASDGLYLSLDSGERWDRVRDFPRDYQVWSLQQSAIPGESASGQRIWAGTCPAALFYSDDMGENWHEAPARWARTCAGGAIRVRITRILSDAGSIWAGAEIDGVQFSADGGHGWTPRNVGLSSLDIHNLALLSGTGDSARLVATTNNDTCLSDDGGQTWKPLNVGSRFRWSYCRGLAITPDHSIYVGNGDGPPGSGGALWCSRDEGSSWDAIDLPETPNSTIWEVIAAGGDLWAYSVLGQVYRSRGEGKWRKLDREFGEIRSLCVLPEASG